MKKNHLEVTKKICGVGVFSALAYVTTCICQLIPKVADFLSLDAKDAVIAIASFIYGPIVAPVISLIVAYIEFVSISTTGFWGFLMNFIASSIFSLTASLIYKYRKSFNGAVIGFAVATAITTAVMLCLNPIIVPLYSGAPREAVIAMIPGILLPFNFAKTLMNASIAMLLYKPMINALRSARLIPRSEHKTTFNKTSVLTLVIGGTALIVAFAVLLVIW